MHEEVVYRYEIRTSLLDIFPVLYVITLFIAGMNQEPNSLYYLLLSSQAFTLYFCKDQI